MVDPRAARRAIRSGAHTRHTAGIAHGAPVHIGKPELIGIADLGQPWVGDATEVHDDELPVFWACGVTPQAVVRNARPPLCITHTPGHMVVTDLTNASLVASA
jgi:uncharacterized protein YcsI (UPF0317 family)